MNYPIGEVETTPVPMRQKARPREVVEEEKKNAEKPWQVREFEDDPTPLKTRVDWVSHGNFAIMQDNPRKKKDDFFPHIYISMELKYFDQIIEAFQIKEKPKDPFEPFWYATLPPRGMHFYDEQLRVFFYRQKEGLVIQQFMVNPYDGVPHYKADELGFILEDFRKIRDVALSAKGMPIHYVKLG